MTEIKIGSTIYVYDINRRQYDEKRNLIEKYCWKPIEIVGETRVSWIGKYGDKFPKRNGKYLKSETEVDEQVWIKQNKYKISRCLDVCYDYEKIKQVAILVGFRPEKWN
jgi:hypothetical protein